MFNYGKDVTDFFEQTHITYVYHGRIPEIDFLKKIYNLKKLPSYDSRFEDAEGDIWQHTINNYDYEDGWVFEDERFELLNGEDEILLNFLCLVFHPAVRCENGYWKEFLHEINALLRNDGYELYPESKISGRDVYGWRKCDPETIALFIPFSQRNASGIKAKKLKLSLPMKIRNQILGLFKKYADIHCETTMGGHNSIFSTEKYVFHDISQFYKPMCYDTNGNYVETANMEDFILHTSPFCVFDAIEFFEKHNDTNDFAAQINTLFKFNSVAYKMERGQIVSTFDVAIDKKDISGITEKGLKELLVEADSYYRSNNKQIAVEKLWDAFERLKTYYSPALNKSASADKIIDDMSGSEQNYYALYKAEFKSLTDIGNNFRIRHHETTKIDIVDNRQYDYFYRRCLALISVAIQYLKGETNA